MKNLCFAVAVIAMISLLASCSKSNSSRADVLTAHKWVHSSSSTTFSDTSLVVNNLAGDSLPCQKDGYTEFRNYINNSTTRQYFVYTESKCVNETTDVTTGNWDLDKEENFLTLSGSASTGSSYNWEITSLDDSKIVLTNKYDTRVSKYTPTTTYPYYVVTYYTRTVTTVDTWTAK
jgi:hypothetical protein